MMRLWRLSAGTLLMLGAFAPPVDALPNTNPNGAVISMSVVPATGRAEVVIGVDGNVEVQDFTLRGPDKIVVDITGATLGLPHGELYDKVARGGIVNVRYSQFKKNVVRVVLTLDSPRAYSVIRGTRDVRIAVSGENTQFQAWHLGERPLARVQVAEPARARVEDAANSGAFGARSVSEELNGRTPVTIVEPLQRSQQQRITITWENAPLTDVLAQFAAFSNRTIIPSKDVKGTVTAEITNQPWDVAMRAILNANGFDATQDENGIIIVDTYENILLRQAAEPLATRTVRLNYSKAMSVADLLRPRLTRDCRGMPGSQSAAPVGGAAPGGVTAAMACDPRGAVVADTLTNSISITDIPAALGDLVEYARSVDVRQPQVNIKAKIILVDRTQLEALGLRYDIGTNDTYFNDVVPRTGTTGGRVLLGGNQMAAVANATARIPGAALQLIYSTAIGNWDFTTFLEALQQNTLLDVQAEPSASVLNNRTANLTAGTQVPIRVIEAATGGNAAGNFPRATVTFQNTGIILQVTPTITNNRQVQMRVHVENSEVQQLPGSDIGAVFPRQSVDNEVLVADGETAVMGGLTQTTVRVTKSGIPILVDLPLIGRLFGVTRREETKRDLLILITPHIIDEGQPMDPNRE